MYAHKPYYKMLAQKEKYYFSTHLYINGEFKQWLK